MDSFFAWLLQNSFKHTRGDIHYAGSGYWYPELPDITTGAAGPVPSGNWIHVEKDREHNAVFIDASYAEGLYTEDPGRAQRMVESLLMKFDEAPSFGGIFPTKDPRIGKRVRVVHWDIPFEGRVHAATGHWLIVEREDDGRLITVRVEDVVFLDKTQALDGFSSGIVKTCSCGKTYTIEEWNELPFIGEQVVEATEDDPEEIWIARQCPCESTLMLDEA